MEAKMKKRQSSQYDKIFKENIEAVILSIMQNLLGITAVSLEELPDDIQHTKERKPDILKKVIDNQGNTFILQIEFQVVDEPEMVYRMLEYKAMLLRKYKIDVEQFVIYIGKDTPKMITQFKSKGIGFEFQLRSIKAVDYQLFLKPDKP
jgi:beta-xylosidase